MFKFKLCTAYLNTVGVLGNSY